MKWTQVSLLWLISIFYNCSAVFEWLIASNCFWKPYVLMSFSFLTHMLNTILRPKLFWKVYSKRWVCWMMTESGNLNKENREQPQWWNLGPEVSNSQAWIKNTTMWRILSLVYSSPSTQVEPKFLTILWMQWTAHVCDTSAQIQPQIIH